MDVGLCTPNEETVFDVFLRKKLNLNTFNWAKIDVNINVFSGETPLEGILIESEICNNGIKQDQPKLYRLIDDKIIKFQDITSKNPEECLKLFFPRFSFIKNKNTGKYAFSLTSLNETKIFSADKVSDIKKWYSKLIPLCVLSNLTQDFKIIKNLGKGNFSVVHLGMSKKNCQEFAIKSIDKEKIQNKLDSIESIVNEILTLRKLNHPHIIKLYDVYETELYIHLVFEYLKGGELFDQIDERGIFSEQEAQSLIKSILLTLKYIHNSNIIHRDLKPENIILQNHDDLLSYKIADFGLACFCLPSEKKIIRCGSAGFVAPESLNKEGYDFKADIFSLGIISHILLTGIPPFQRNTYKETIMANKECILNFEHEMWNNVSIEAKYFIKDVTIRDPEKRPSVVKAIENPWFKLKLKKSESIFEIVELSNAIQAKYDAPSPEEISDPMGICLFSRTPLMAKRKIDPNPEYNNIIFQKFARPASKIKMSKIDSPDFTNKEFEEVCEIPEEESIPTETLYRFNTKQLKEPIDFGNSKHSVPLKSSESIPIYNYNPTEKESFKNKLQRSAVPDCASKNKLLDNKKMRDYSPPAYIFQKPEFDIPLNIGSDKDNKAFHAKDKNSHSLNNNHQTTTNSQDKFISEHLKKNEALAGFESKNYRNSLNTQAERNEFKVQMSKIKESKNDTEEEDKWNFNADDMNEDTKS